MSNEEWNQAHAGTAFEQPMQHYVGITKSQDPQGRNGIGISRRMVKALYAGSSFTMPTRRLNKIVQQGRKAGQARGVLKGRTLSAWRN